MWFKARLGDRRVPGSNPATTNYLTNSFGHTILAPICFCSPSRINWYQLVYMTEWGRLVRYCTHPCLEVSTKYISWLKAVCNLEIYV